MTSPDKLRNYWDQFSLSAVGRDMARVPEKGDLTPFQSVPCKRNSLQLQAYEAADTKAVFIGKLMSLGKPEDNGKTSHTGTSFLDFKSVLLSILRKSLYESNTRLFSEINCDGDVKWCPVGRLMPSDSQWYELNQLRIHAGAPERSNNGIRRLLHYFAQLLYLEIKFPFATDEILCRFSWYDAFATSKKVSTFCLQYEKAAVLFNLGATYTQIAASQKFSTVDGTKKAAISYQRAAGVFGHIRDTLCPRFKIKLDKGADLRESTLSLYIELSLAQAHECFFERANQDRSSSSVISQIAAQTAGHYETALQASKSDSVFVKNKLPKEWVSFMKIKGLLYTAIAHFHAPTTMHGDVAIGERIARLVIAKTLAEKAQKESVEYGGAAQEQAEFYATQITAELHARENENQHLYQEQILSAHLLTPLRRLQHTLVVLVPVPDVLNSRTDDGMPLYSDLLDCPMLNTDMKSTWFTCSQSISTLVNDLLDNIRKAEREIDGKISAVFQQLEISNGLNTVVTITDDETTGMGGRLSLLKKNIIMCQADEERQPLHDLITLLDDMNVDMGSELQKAILQADHANTTLISLDPHSYATISEMRASLTLLENTLSSIVSQHAHLRIQYNKELLGFSPMNWSEDHANAIFNVADAIGTNKIIAGARNRDELYHQASKAREVQTSLQDLIYQIESFVESSTLFGRLNGDISREKSLKDTLVDLNRRANELQTIAKQKLSIKHEAIEQLIVTEQRFIAFEADQSAHADAVAYIISFEQTLQQYTTCREHAKQELLQYTEWKRNIQLLLSQYPTLPWKKVNADTLKTKFHANTAVEFVEPLHHIPDCPMDILWDNEILHHNQEGHYTPINKTTTTKQNHLSWRTRNSLVESIPNLRNTFAQLMIRHKADSPKAINKPIPFSHAHNEEVENNVVNKLFQEEEARRSPREVYEAPELPQLSHAPGITLYRPIRQSQSPEKAVPLYSDLSTIPMDGHCKSNDEKEDANEYIKRTERATTMLASRKSRENDLAQWTLEQRGITCAWQQKYGPNTTGHNAHDHEFSEIVHLNRSQSPSSPLSVSTRLHPASKISGQVQREGVQKVNQLSEKVKAKKTKQKHRPNQSLGQSNQISYSHRTKIHSDKHTESDETPQTLQLSSSTSSASTIIAGSKTTQQYLQNGKSKSTKIARGKKKHPLIAFDAYALTVAHEPYIPS